MHIEMLILKIEGFLLCYVNMLNVYCTPNTYFIVFNNFLCNLKDFPFLLLQKGMYMFTDFIDIDIYIDIYRYCIDIDVDIDKDIDLKGRVTQGI